MPEYSPSISSNAGSVMASVLRSVARTVLAALSLGALVACSSLDRRLDATEWQLQAWSMSSLRAEQFGITAKFAEGRISGRSGVNSYGGPYAIGPGGTFSVGPLVSTEMAGPEPAMRAEAAYVSLLGQAKSYQLADGQLSLLDQGGNELLTFAAAAGAKP